MYNCLSQLLQIGKVGVREVVRQRVRRQQDAREDAAVDVQHRRRRPRRTPPCVATRRNVVSRPLPLCHGGVMLTVRIGIALRGAEPAPAVPAEPCDAAASLQPCRSTHPNSNVSRGGARQQLDCYLEKSEAALGV